MNREDVCELYSANLQKPVIDSVQVKETEKQHH